MVGACAVWPEILGGSHPEAEFARLADRGVPPPNWANWISMVIDDDCEPVLRSVGCGALLAYTTDGLPPEDVAWASPQDVVWATEELSRLIREDAQSIRELVAVYEDFLEQEKPSGELLVEDLAAVRKIALSIAAQGKTKMAFELAF